MRLNAKAILRTCRSLNGAVLIIISAWFFLIPGCIVVKSVLDPDIRNGNISSFTVRLHRALTPKYEKWARSRVASHRASALPVEDISGTEWPLFGSVFYLWATEDLQAAWEEDRSLTPTAPREYARGAIEAATELVIDPNHAAWVRKHWGEDYLKRENAFYRMLVIAALTVHAKLTGEERYQPKLRECVDDLATEIEASEWGLLHDYPNECYPGDVLTAIACIRRADPVLGTDHSEFVERAVRGFRGDLLDRLGLVPYSADLRHGRAGISRGCGNSYVSLFAPELWPEQAARWYSLYEEHFWQYRLTAYCFREFPKDLTKYDWYMDVDSGPVVAGHGFAAGAFGVGAARANGRFDHAYPLTAEMIAISWPLAAGSLTAPRLLSNSVDAPYLGEAGILFNLTRRPVDGVPEVHGGEVPLLVYLLLLGYFGVGGGMVFAAVRSMRKPIASRPHVPALKAQTIAWALLSACGVLAVLLLSTAVGILLLLLAQLLPRALKRPAVQRE